MGMMKDGMLFAFALIGGGKKICGTGIWVDDWTSSEEVNDGTWRENSKQFCGVLIHLKKSTTMKTPLHHEAIES
jgi:hypothetical protein